MRGAAAIFACLALAACQTAQSPQSGPNLNLRQQAMYDYLISEGMDKNMALVTTLTPGLQDAYFDEKKCKGYGAKPGSDAYVACRAQLEAGHRSQAPAPVIVQSSGASYYPAPVAASDAPVLAPLPGPPVRCQSVPAGMGTVQTTCR